SLLGTVISDSLWFFLGQFFFQLTKRWEKYQGKYQSFMLKLEEWTRHEPFFALLFIKFLYGTRILTIIYLSARKVRFSTFFFFNFIGTVIWLAVVISIGWLVGKGVGGAGTALHQIQYAITVLVLLIIFYKIATAWLSRKITKK
ncbi:MAG: VTT domain-containing protein, partial [Parcubacteria group bacterium]